MAAKQKDLIGRPLVPYFTDKGHVNASLQISRDMAHEPMEVDARVWNASQGYFEYPDEQPPHSPPPHASSSSVPKAKAGGLLLTPQRLGTSIKEVRGQSREKTPPPAPIVAASPSTASPDQPAPSKKKGKKSSPNNDKQTKNSKASASAPASKWAWSAFQNSPDPKSLPIPPFLSPQILSHEPEPTPRMAPLNLNVMDKKPPPPSKPPNPQVTILQRPKPSEEQMTQQLRKMLNIGGSDG
ncbi:hypothetical protein H310_12680 [Aphanomyces invadans]|uniref:Uncharacterized protein n=1 Tax=Aphanomyces invadans TaxID=157072 RepID=A0A024TGV3_9STRA|nr:hypothetical protein H310_12680 [Aphanomyces invadans]ETV93239.1 hypothetical protein H310_12680 [Aphanomyces invadans]|eukprot:XP_008878074.1 hypothetical protein H310_12680 [Aphanomyces invadans]